MSNQNSTVTTVEEGKRGLRSLLDALEEEKAGSSYWMQMQIAVPVSGLNLEEYKSFIRHTIQSLSAFKDDQVINFPLKYGVDNPAEHQLATRVQEIYSKKVELAGGQDAGKVQAPSAAETQAVEATKASIGDSRQTDTISTLEVPRVKLGPLRD